MPLKRHFLSTSLRLLSPTSSAPYIWPFFKRISNSSHLINQPTLTYLSRVRLLSKRLNLKGRAALASKMIGQPTLTYLTRVRLLSKRLNLKGRDSRASLEMIGQPTLTYFNLL